MPTPEAHAPSTSASIDVIHRIATDKPAETTPSASDTSQVVKVYKPPVASSSSLAAVG